MRNIVFFVASVFAALSLFSPSGCASHDRDVASDSGSPLDAAKEDASQDAGKPIVLDSGISEDSGKVCPAECAPYDVTGVGDSTCPLGYGWSGTDCILLHGCTGCQGADCAKLMTFQDCQKLGLKCLPLCL